MADNEKTVPLKGDGKVRMFTPEHAARLLAYPGTLWTKVEPEVKPAPEKPKRSTKTK